MGYLTQHESPLILNKNQLDVQLYLWVNIEVLSTDNIFLLCLWIIQQPAISHYKEPGNTKTRHFNMNFKMIQSTAPCFLSSLQNRPWKPVSDQCHYSCKANWGVNAKVYLLLIYSTAPRTLLFSPLKKSPRSYTYPTAKPSKLHISHSLCYLSCIAILFKQPWN